MKYLTEQRANELRAEGYTHIASVVKSYNATTYWHVNSIDEIMANGGKWIPAAKGQGYKLKEDTTMEATLRHPRTLYLYSPAEELEALATEYKGYQRQQESLKALMEATKAAMIDAMGGQDTVVVGVYKITNKEITSTRLDTKALQSEQPGLYARYAKTTTATRFDVR